MEASTGRMGEKPTARHQLEVGQDPVLREQGARLEKRGAGHWHGHALPRDAGTIALPAPRLPVPTSPVSETSGFPGQHPPAADGEGAGDSPHSPLGTGGSVWLVPSQEGLA